MKQALTIFSWIAIILGTFAIVGGVAQVSVAPEDAYYSLLGGVLFLTQGVLAIAYMNKQK